MGLTLPTALIVAPAAAGVVAMLLGTRGAAIVTTIVAFLVQVALLSVGVALVEGTDLSWASSGYSATWIDAWNINYSVAIDATTLGFAALTTIVTACAGVFAWWAQRERLGAFTGLLWLTAASLCGLWVARDLVLFYVFFELMLVFLLFLVGRWGGAERIRATLTMFIYTLVGSLFMLLGVIGVGLGAGTFDLNALAQVEGRFAWWIVASFLLAFAIKGPVVGLHGWLPLSYRQAPIEVTAILSGVVSKAAMYGVLRIMLPVFDTTLADWAMPLMWVSLATLLYASIAAFRQEDARGVVAYSSIAQMGLIFLGLFAVADNGRITGASGAYLQAINHGLLSAALFLLIGIIELRAGSDRLRSLGGLATGRPVLASLALVIALCALAVPGSNAFAGELLILLGAFQSGWVYATFGGLAIVLAAMYMLRLLSALMHTDRDDEPHLAERSLAAGADLRRVEGLALLPLVACIVALSVWPAVLSREVENDYGKLIGASATASDPGAAQVAAASTEEHE